MISGEGPSSACSCWPGLERNWPGTRVVVSPLPHPPPPVRGVPFDVPSVKKRHQESFFMRYHCSNAGVRVNGAGRRGHCGDGLSHRWAPANSLTTVLPRARIGFSVSKASSSANEGSGQGWPFPNLEGLTFREGKQCGGEAATPGTDAYHCVEENNMRTCQGETRMAIHCQAVRDCKRNWA